MKSIINLPFLDKGIDVIESNNFERPVLILNSEDFKRFKQQYEEAE